MDPAWFQRLNLAHDELLANVALNLNPRPCMMEQEWVTAGSLRNDIVVTGQYTGDGLAWSGAAASPQLDPRLTPG